MYQDTSSDLGPIYEWLFSTLPPYKLPRPWDFVTVDPDCRGTISDPDRLLCAAREKFGDEAMRNSGVLRQLPGCKPHVNPALCNPVGAIIALRESETQEPYELLTARGCLSGSTVPLFAIRRNAWTEAHLVAHGENTGVIFLTPRICEVALLRALGYAATLSLGMHRLDWDKIQILAPPDAEKAWDDVAATAWRQPADPVAENPIDDHEAADTSSAGDDEPATDEGKFISLADVEWELLAWQPSTLSLHMPPYVASIVARWNEVAEDLDLDPLVEVSRPDTRDVQKVHRRLKYANTAQVEKVFADCIRGSSSMKDFAATGGMVEEVKYRPPANCIEASAELRAQLASNRSQREKRPDTVLAYETYDELVSRDLIAPLQTWALGHRDPVLRSAGMTLADLFAIVHRMAPDLHELHTRQRTNTGMLGGGEESATSLASFEKILGKATRLMKELLKLREME